MHKDFVPPVSIEEFAAYLDGNLTEDGMNEVASAIHSDDSLQDILSSGHIVDETLANYEPLELTIPEEITSTDFDIPQVDDNDYLNIGDWADLDVAACASDILIDDTNIGETDLDMNNHVDSDDYLTDITSDQTTSTDDDFAGGDCTTDIETTDYNDL